MLEALADTMIHPGLTAYHYRSIQGKLIFLIASPVIASRVRAVARPVIRLI
jgi:hypothetical protein